MIWIGLTGGIASGKTTVAEIFSSLGVAVVGADQLAHDAMAAGSAGALEVRSSFGDDVFKPDGTVDRPKLGALVFSDGTGVLRARLEAILHPAVRRQSELERTRLEARGDALAVYEIPLLFEKNLESHFDIIVTVAIQRELQVDRLMARNGLSLDDAHSRMASQLSQDVKIHASDFVIWNDADVAHLRRQVEKIVNELKREPRRR